MSSLDRGYKPDVWVLVEVKTPGNPSAVKVLAGWLGGYTWGSSWQLSSGVTQIATVGNEYHMKNVSGSLYIGHKSNERLSSYTAQMLEGFNRQLEASGGSMEVITVAEAVGLLI